MAWTTKPTGTITLKSTGLAATLTKAWVIDTGSGLTFTEYYSSGNDLVMPASAVTWNSAPTTADIGQYDSTSWIDMSDLEGTLVFVFTPLNWDYTAADFKLISKSV